MKPKQICNNISCDYVLSKKNKNKKQCFLQIYFQCGNTMLGETTIGDPFLLWDFIIYKYSFFTTMEWPNKKKLIHGSTVDLQRKPWDQTAHVHYATKDLPPKLKNIRKIIEYGKATPVLLLVIPSIHRLREVSSWNKILHSSTENRILTVHSGIVSSTGLQAFLSSALDLSPTNPLLGESPPPPIPIASGKTSFLSLSFPSTTSSSPWF